MGLNLRKIDMSQRIPISRFIGRSVSLVLIIGGFSVSLAAETEAEELSGGSEVMEHPGRAVYERYCLACHKYDRSQPMLAPPIFAVKDHYLRRFADPEALKVAMIRYITSGEKREILMPGAVQKFGEMPVLPYPEEALSEIIDFVLETDFSKPDWYDAHFKAEHPDAAP